MKNSKLMEALNNCIVHCNYCADACLDEKDVKMMINCIRTDRACAEICNTTLNLLSSNYADAKDMVAYCYKTCLKCAEECAKHDAKHCKDCAEACRKCAEACKAYLN
ncbi:MAG TPA: four-helix bundle copper-binding protein [Flavobacteriaceae bacterium]|nr:four-helix bundle copper-binding protein [Flavobacteriaceae bacterium]